MRGSSDLSVSSQAISPVEMRDNHAIYCAGDDAVGAATCCSPPLTTTQVVVEAEKLQGLREISSEEALAGTGGDSPPAAVLNEERRTAAAAGVAGMRRMLVGSRAPTCTYNECRGCRHRCSVQEVPIDASDPINSAYHYRCICHL
ncbi:hypothetical protein HU200_061900 [Digitaria exilis]|uniref:Stomagen C-terminal domain-containing protein n=1 Tax=Digitaria exilis TaxID=1010633 RepID=A0A835A7I3_9POAL|nr:hypothetical protein HU200_061900 [Digitaria exilis]